MLVSDEDNRAEKKAVYFGRGWNPLVVMAILGNLLLKTRTNSARAYLAHMKR